MAKEENKNPESLEEVKSVTLTDNIKTFVGTLSTTVETEETNRARWEQTIDRLKNLRYGIRAKKTKPWPNCANFSLPLADSDINRLKPSYMNLIGITPVVVFEPFGAEDIEPARKRELLLDWRLRTKVKMFQQYAYGIDYLLGQGAVVFKTVWKFKTNSYTEMLDLKDFSPEVLNAIYDARITDNMLFAIIQEHLNVDTSFDENIEAIEKTIEEFKEGKSKFELNLLEVKENRPQVVARNLREDVVIPLDTLILDENLDDARLIDDRNWTTKNDIKIAMRDEMFEEYADASIEGWAGKSVKKKNEAITTSADENILLHETCCWYDVNGDGIEERCIVTWPDASPENVLRFIELPYDHGQWPYTLIKRELTNPSVYSSRGIPVLDEDYQVGISTALNQAIDNGTIVNSPKVVYRKNSITNIRNTRYIPGESVETRGPTTDYEIRQQVNLSQGVLFQQAQYLKNWANERIGSPAAGMSETTNLPGAGQGGKKTAKEIDFRAFLRGETQSLDLMIFQQQMVRVYCQVDALYEQFGDDEEEILITGQQPMQVTRQEIQGKFNIVPNGRLDNTNPMLRAYRIYNLMKMFMGDPDIRQYELKKLFLDDYDARVSGKILLTAKEIQQRDQQMKQEEQALKKELLGEQVETKTIADTLDIRKEYALSLFQGKKFAPD